MIYTLTGCTLTPDMSGAERNISGGIRGEPQRPVLLLYLQSFFLKRLERGIHLREEYAVLGQSGDWWMKLLDRFIYSSFCDCLDLGVGEDARRLMRKSTPEDSHEK